MAINVNTVYTTVLSILNKEQRGYLTPFEFNQVATQVQLDIFEKFFQDYNQYIRMPQTDVEFASRMDHTMEEFQIFEKSANASNAPTTNEYTQPTDLHRFGSASWTVGTNSPPIEIISNKVYNQIKLSDLTQPSKNLPVAKYNQNKLTVFPDPGVYANTDVVFNYIRKPIDPVWNYTVGAVGQYVFDPVSNGVSKDFEISDSQQTEVILEILKYSGVIVRDAEITQAASTLIAKEENNSKQ